MFAAEQIIPTADQLAVLQMGQRDGRHIHVSGGERSGKSRFGTYSFLHWAGTSFTGHNFALCAKSATTFQANVGGYLEEFAQDYGLALKKVNRCYQLESSRGTPNFFYPILFSGSASGGVGAQGGLIQVARNEGPTFAGALIDEACECPEEMIRFLGKATSVRGAKIVYCYFPQGNQHPLKLQNYDLVESGQLSGEIHHLSIEDNPANSKEYVEENKARWKALPHEYANRIEGRWHSATGIVFEGFEQHLRVGVNDDTLKDVNEWVVSADWARSSVCAAILVGYHPLHGKFYVAGEYCHDGRIHGVADTATKVQQLIETMTGGKWNPATQRFEDMKRRINTWIIDPNEDGLRSELNRQAPSGIVIDAVTGKEEGTKTAIEYMQSGDYVFCQSKVPMLISNFNRQRWNRKAQAVGKDIPDKESADGSHFIDCWEYYCSTNKEWAHNRNPYSMRSIDV